MTYSNSKYPKYYWLNDDSRTFLSRGYINETPEQRIKDIAVTAEKYLGIVGFAKKFEDYMSRGFYSLSTPVWINFGKQKGLSISCLTGDSWINTYLEGGKQIKDAKIGDLVLTHKGRYKKIIDKQSRNSNDDLYELKVQTRLTPIKSQLLDQILERLFRKLSIQNLILAMKIFLLWRVKKYQFVVAL